LSADRNTKVPNGLLFSLKSFRFMAIRSRPTSGASAALTPSIGKAFAFNRRFKKAYGIEKDITRDSFERRMNTKKAARRAPPVVSQKRTFSRGTNKRGSDSISRWLLFGTTGLDVYGQSHSKW